MSHHEKAELREALRFAFSNALREIGLEAFKRMSFFGSTDPAFVAAKASRAVKIAA